VTSPCSARRAPDRRQPQGHAHARDIERIVLDGFFPLNEGAGEAQRARAGIVEFGLPYASDPAVTRHLAGFLRQHAAAAREALGLPETTAACRCPTPCC
jgi:hypothetical protein